MIVPIKNTLIRYLSPVILYMALLALPATTLAQDEEVRIDTVISSEEYAVDSVTATVTDETGDDSYEKAPPVSPELREVPDSVVRNLKAKKDFEYASNPDYWKKDPIKKKKEEDNSDGESVSEGLDNFLSAKAVRTFFYILIGVLLLLLIYRIVMVNNLFMTRSSKKRMATPEEEEEVLDNTSLEARIKAAIGEKNYRDAVRYMYLKTLFGLHEKGWIRYHAQGTIQEYLNQINPYGVNKEFRFLTHVYEYVWYGEFALSEDQFNQVHQQFLQFYNSAKL